MSCSWIIGNKPEQMCALYVLQYVKRHQFCCNDGSEKVKHKTLVVFVWVYQAVGYLVKNSANSKIL